MLDEVREWQNRPLDPVYPVVFFDALRVKIRDEGLVKNKAVYVALALNPDGEKDVLGLWIEQTEGAKFWLKVVNELKARGVNDILIAVVDGLKGFPEAITSVFPQTMVQTCIVHLIRNSLAFVSWKDRKAILPAIKAIYRAETADMALVRLEEFEAEWGKRYPAIGQAWRRAWEHVVPFFAFAPEHPQDDLHHQRGRGAEPVAAQDHQNPRQLSERRCGAEAALPCHQECRPALAARDRMDGRDGPVCHSVRRAFSGNSTMTKNRHHGTVDDRLVRTFAVKPRAFGAPLRGLGA